MTEGTASVVKYAPIWPDDYIYFGQMLTYDYSTSRPHNDLPTHIVKSSGRLPFNDQGNRVYRAPAYYQSKEMSVAHYNLNAYLAAKSAQKTITDTNMKDAYPNMTAIDFAGHNDNTWSLGGSTRFYQPLLDNEDGLLNIVNEGETPNLLVYAPSAEANESTYTILTSYFVDPEYNNYYLGGDYRCVKVAPTGDIHGHLVQNTLTATNDHLLVDKQDFHCPIGYTFDTGKRMWYQRMPDRYVSLSNGWETVSLPFTAELVTTQQKGEITHFYSGSRSVDANDTKIGHEYWLREYNSVKSTTGSEVTVTMNYPEKAGAAKSVSNTFLWDYYYNANGQLDANGDKYQTYYNEKPRTYAEYPLLTGAKPYIIGFPGTTYYEFDLSGTFIPKNTAAETPVKLDPQTISFVSDTGISISADDLSGKDEDGYCFMPNYMSKTPAGTYYTMDAVGDKFVQPTGPAAGVVPFRPYFVVGTSTPAPASTIYFDDDNSSFAIGDEDPSEGEVGEGALTFTVGRRKITVTSSLRRDADVRIVNVGGLTIANYTIQPGETITTDIPVSGVYIVHAANGRYQKKLAVR